LIALGRPAIDPLRRFLCEGAPGVTFQPRQWAVQALAALAAKDALVEYLRQDRQIADPAVRLAEEAVQISAARALKRWVKDQEVITLMFEIAATRIQAGVVEALGAARRAEAIPYLISALEDDVCRRAAEHALFSFGALARKALVAAATKPTPNEAEESPSSRLRRRSALTLLSRMLLPRSDWRTLRRCLDSRDPEILAAAARLAAKLGNRDDKAVAVRRLTEVRESADSFLQQEIDECLRAVLSGVRP